MKIPNYQLIDCGDGEKLEKFADKILLRPSTVAFWKKRIKNWNWDAAWDPKKGWLFKGPSFDSFIIDVGVKLEVRLQSNGQIGIFPEHALYMKEFTKIISEKKDCNILNLFAYTGMASNFALKANARVTHVDILKKCLDWMQKNRSLNALDERNLRLVPEDALVYLKREAKRNQKYDIVVADPPSFYRIDHSRVWNLEENFHYLMELILPVLKKDGYLFLSCHSFSLEIFKNLVLDYPKLEILACKNLSLTDSSNRELPAGVFVLCRYLGS